jgi:uncharacterized protein
MLKTIEDVVGFRGSSVHGVTELNAREAVLSGPYTSTTWTHYSDPTGAFSAGIWEAEECREAYMSEHEEFCHVLDGTIRLVDEKGGRMTFSVGDSFVVPAGFKGTWENVGFVRKAFVILQTVNVA